MVVCLDLLRCLLLEGGGGVGAAGLAEEGVAERLVGCDNDGEGDEVWCSEVF